MATRQDNTQGTVSIVWFRRDLRLEDHPALEFALRAGGAVAPVYILDDQADGPWAARGPVRAWLRRSLAELGRELEGRGSRLILRKGNSKKILTELAQELKARGVFASRACGPEQRNLEVDVKAELDRLGVPFQLAEAGLIFNVEQILTLQGQPYSVFTPFYKTCLGAGEPPQPRPAPNRLTSPRVWPDSLSIQSLFPEKSNEFKSIMDHWQPGASGVERQWEWFLEHALPGYTDGRDRPNEEGTSRLSPHLAFGEISPRRLWHAVREREEFDRRPGVASSARAWLRQLVWREFAHSLLIHFPHTPAEPLRPAFVSFPWESDPQGLAAWREGRTGYPLVDAGMRQLRATGWMHNRVRMIAASFLVKDLLIPWQEGAAWFWQTLVDADLANNTLGWQWVAGCGADAAPYFRVFNPALQGERYDPRGDYVRRWVPELGRLPARWIHQPWRAPSAVLAEAGVRLDNNYPRPIVDHERARVRALAAYARMRQKVPKEVSK